MNPNDFDSSFILAGLKQAVITAFFQQQQYYDGQQFRYHGGQAVELVSKILNSEPMRQLIDGLVKEIGEDKNHEMLTKIKESLSAKIETGIESFLKSGNHELSRTMERLFNEQARKAMENLLLTDEKFKQSIEEKVKGQEYTLTIHVTATVKNPS